jgi:post-segregation antitoxin (ccd killing protein)
MKTSTATVEVNSEILAEAERMAIDTRRVMERALKEEISSRRKAADTDATAREWQAEHAEAIDWSNRYLEKNGFPFPQYRRY